MKYRALKIRTIFYLGLLGLRRLGRLRYRRVLGICRARLFEGFDGDVAVLLAVFL